MSPLRYGGDIALRREFIRILATIKRREAQQASSHVHPSRSLRAGQRRGAGQLPPCSDLSLVSVTRGTGITLCFGAPG